jgi:7-keto-8-aminopelargonate synthetase-like enzyme
MMYYDHCDAVHLDYLLEYNRGSKPLVITDGIFALTGEIAPLNQIYDIVRKHNAILVVDDAHATGVLGVSGRGTPEHFNLPDDPNIYQTETMSKALGGYGGFISGSRVLTEIIREGSPTYQASTALPPPIAAAGIASLTIIRENPGLRTDLLDRAWKIREAVTGMDFQTTHFRTPVIPIILDAPEKAAELSLFLEENGVIAPFMKYPVRKAMHQIRIAVSVTHTDDQINQLLELLKKWKDKNESNQN